MCIPELGFPPSAAHIPARSATLDTTNDMILYDVVTAGVCVLDGIPGTDDLAIVHTAAWKFKLGAVHMARFDMK
jgi:hypothetical protein